MKLELTGEKQKNISPTMILQKIDLDLTLAEYDNKKIGIEILIDEIKKNPRIGENFLKPDIMGKIIENVVMMDIFTKEFIKSGLDTNEDYIKSINNNRNNALIRKYKDLKINKSTKITADEIQKYYDDNKNKEYMIPEKSEVSEIFFESKDSAEQILKKVLLDKENFQSYADKHTKRYNTKPRKGYLGFISDKQYGSIGKTAATMEKNTIYPNIIKSGKGYSIILVKDKKEAKAKDISLVKNNIKSMLATKKKKDVEKQLFKKLYKKYKVKIYWECVNISA